MKRIIISVLILTILGAMASAAPNITMTLNTTLESGNAVVTDITNAVLLDSAGGIIGTAVLPDNITAQFDLDGITPGDYFIEINGLAGDRVPTRIDSNESDINQSVGMRLINSVIGNDTTPTIYRIKARSGGRHPVVNYNTGANETKYPFVIVSALTSKIEVRAVNTSEELSNFSTTGNAHPFQTWILGSNNHGIVYGGTDTCSVCHGSLDLKLPNYSDIVPPFPAPSGGWCFKCHYGPEGDARGFVDPAVVAANGTIAGAVTNESGSAIAGATVAADTQSNITDINGNYTISIGSGTYTLTASATGYQSNSTSITVTSGATVTQNFALTTLPLEETFILSGFKIDNSTGTGLADWNITLTKPDNTVLTNVTDSSGMYQFMNLPNGTYTVAEEMQPGWTNVSPTTITVTINGADMMNQNFTNIIQVQPEEEFNISGFKIDNDTGMGLENWNITLTKPDNTVLNNVTDSNGMYQFMNLPNGTYTVTEEMQQGWTNVSAMSMEVTIAGSDMMNQNFTNIIQVQPEEEFNISGFKIDNNTGMGLENWNITLTKPDNTVMNNVTDSNGMYQFMNLPNGIYTVTEEMQPEWTNISATSMEVTIADSDMVNQNFTNAMIPQQPNVTSFELTPSKTAVLKGKTITITIKALNVNVTDTNFNGMADITVNASKNASAVTYLPNVTFNNGIAILPVTSNIAQFVTVTATNGSITGSTEIAFADMVFNLDLGWNLISIPNFADPSSLDLALKNVKNNGVVGYDPGDKNFSTPTDLQPLYGYWINVTAPNQSIGFIADTNIRSVPPSRNLYEGWNLIGVVANKQEQNKELHAGQLFQPLKTGGKPLYSYLVSYKNPRKTYSVGNDLTDRTTLNKGQGYWLFMNTLTETNKNSLVWAGKPWLP
ncbi:Serine-aspartate repeat-containing protein D [Methanosarcinales archaeon]|nr:Serine-aspartate repeat-containing protein D [Methanosarcinales archaeon]